MESEELKNFIEAITLSGSPVLDETMMRGIKKLCKRSEDNVKIAFDLTLKQLSQDHSEIRLSSFLIMDQLFRRSHRFRTIALKNLNILINLVFEVDSTNPLPLPKEAAEILKVKAIVAVDEWMSDYGTAYKRLKLAHHYLRNCHKIDFENVTARNRSQQRLIQQKEEQRKKQRLESLEKTRKEAVDAKESIVLCITQLEAGIGILVPTLTNICSNLEFDEQDFKAEVPDSEAETMRQHGLGGTYSLEINLNGVTANDVRVSEKNSELVRNMDDLAKEIERKKFKLLKKLIFSLTKNEGSQSEVVELVNLRERMNALVKKYQSLNLVRHEKPSGNLDEECDEDDDDDDDDDDDFEEVKDVDEKEGYEPRIPQHLRKDYGLDDDDSAQRQSDSLSKKNTGKPAARLVTKTPQQQQPRKRRHEEDDDPTTRGATMKRLNESGILHKLEGELQPKKNERATASSSSKSSSNAPVVPYDKDLYYLFENPNAPLPTMERNESLHRFWKPREDTEATVPTSVEAGMKMRKMHFTGKFIPVQHKCNVPLPSGKLCPRMDRVKCPFHGVIIPRDTKGLPVDPEQREKEIRENSLREEQASELVKDEEKKWDVEEAEAPASSSSSEVPPWLDITLIKDIEAQTGKDLGSKYLEKKEKRGKGKKDKGKGKSSKKKPESNLTNVKSQNDTVRSRLEKKLFNPTTLKRVNAVLNQMDKQKTFDKFSDNFNYVHGLDKG